MKLEAKLLLLDHCKTYAAEPLLYILNADTLRLWTAFYQTQHLVRGEKTKKQKTIMY